MRPTVQSIPLLRKIKAANEGWFSPSNKRFFHDVSYMGYYGGATGRFDDFLDSRFLHYQNEMLSLGS